MMAKNPVVAAMRGAPLAMTLTVPKRPLADWAVVRPTLRHLADRVASRLRAKGRSGRTVTVRVRFSDLRSVTRSASLPHPVAATAILAEVAEGLVWAALRDHPEERTISLLAISVSQIEAEASALQLDFALGLADERLRPGARAGRSRPRRSAWSW